MDELHVERRPRIRAIPTRYGSIEFRSKLEADVAACFDAAGVEWAYEQEGYDLDGVWYLPDLWLPRARQFVEVKGQADDPSVEKCIRLAHTLQVRDAIEDENECSYPPRVVVLAAPFLERSCGDKNTVRGFGFNGVERTESPLCRCHFCGVAFFATTDGQHDCSACGKYQHDHPFGDLNTIKMYAEHRRGRTHYEIAR